MRKKTRKKVLFSLIAFLMILLIATITWGKFYESEFVPEGAAPDEKVYEYKITNIKGPLKKALLVYYQNPANSQIEVSQLKDMLKLYLEKPTGQTRINVTGRGSFSGFPFKDIIEDVANITLNLTIPECTDGTPYAECSSNKPKYCYVGRLDDVCQVCGCPSANQACLSSGKCGRPCTDDDGDTYNATGGPGGRGTKCGPADCDDEDTTVYAGALEICDGKDNNCDGLIDEGCPPSCIPSTEICDGIDNDCDGEVDEGFGIWDISEEFTPDPNTKALWHFNEVNGEVIDSSGKGVSGTRVGGVTQGAPGKFGNAYDFNGVDGYVKLPGTFLSEGLQQGTIETWVKISTYETGWDGHIIFNRGIPASHTAIALGLGNGKMGASINDQALPNSNSQVPLNEWVHLALTWNDTTYQYFINGILDKTMPSNGVVVPAGGDISVEIGRDDQNLGFFDGTIDEVRVSDIVRAGQCGVACTPNTEICDGIDNDCDGEVDEGDVCITPCVKERQITSDLSGQVRPSIYGNKIVWEDWRNGEYDIYMYDLSTSTETQITFDSNIQLLPTIYEDKVVWYDNRNGNWDIYMYDLSTNTETQITTNPSSQVEPAMYINKILWEDNRNGNWDIYMYDLSTNTETQITTNPSKQIYAEIYNDKIVWWDSRNDAGDIYMYDLSTSTEIQITKGSNNQYAPEIYEDKIVWMGWNPSTNWDAYLYDLSTGIETQIASNSYIQNFPVIYGDKMAWWDNRNGNWDIYMYDLSNGTETQLISNPDNQEHLDIYGDKIVWMDDRNGEYDIYMYDLSC